MQIDQDFDARQWQQWLQEIEAHDADASIWDTLAQFSWQLAQLAQVKLSERQARRDALRHSLTTLVELCADALDYFGFDECAAAWSADDCAGTGLTRRVEEVEEFRHSLDYYYYVALSHPPTSLAEMKKARAALEETEARIICQFGELTEMFNATTTIDNCPELPAPIDARAEAISSLCEPLSSFAKQEAAATAVNIFDDQASAVDESSWGQEIESDEWQRLELAAESDDDYALLDEQFELDGQSLSDESLSDEGTADVADIGDDGQDNAPAPAPTPATAADILKFEMPRPAVPESARPIDGGGGGIALTATFQGEEAEAGVLTPREAAAGLLLEETDNRWRDFIWSLVASDDVPGAFWVTKSLAARGRPHPVPEWLLRAVEAGRLVLCEKDEMGGKLSRIAREQQPGGALPNYLLGLAAALQLALVCPPAGMDRWLTTHEELPELAGVVAAVGQFAGSGVALRPEDLLGADGAARRGAAISNIAGAVKRLDETTSSQLKEASDVWLRLVANDDDLSFVLRSVYEDRRDQTEELRRQLASWEDAATVNQKIQAARAEAAGGRNAKPLGAAARERLTRTVEQVRGLVRQWCEHVEHDGEATRRHSLVREHVEQLRARLDSHLPEAQAAVQHIDHAGAPVANAAAARCLHRALVRLRETLTPPAAVSLPTNGANTAETSSETLDAALARRLQWVYEIKLDAQGQPEEASLPVIAGALRDSAARSKRHRRAALNIA